MCQANVTELNNYDRIDTIKKSEDRFSERDKKRARLAIRLQNVAGHPSDATIIYSAAMNTLRNNPVQKRDVLLALDMKGRSERTCPGGKAYQNATAGNRCRGTGCGIAILHFGILS